MKADAGRPLAQARIRQQIQKSRTPTVLYSPRDSHNRGRLDRAAVGANVRGSMQWFASKLSAAGFDTEIFAYHSVADGLNYVATWNAAMLMSEDLQRAMMANMSKQAPDFRD